MEVQDKVAQGQAVIHRAVQARAEAPRQDKEGMRVKAEIQQQDKAEVQRQDKAEMQQQVLGGMRGRAAVDAGPAINLGRCA